MNVLVIGRGGREHALCWKLRQSPLVETLYCAPGNVGIAAVADIVDVMERDFARIVAFAREKHIDLVVVGSEDPLFAGLVDVLTQAGIRAFGPTKAAAALEGSKQFAKQLMGEHHIPTAAYAVFSTYAEALAYVRTQTFPLVIKADGLAAGKGVTIAQSLEEATHTLHALMVERRLGEAGAQVVVEQFLQGEEVSILCFVDGDTVYPMPAVQDHKTIYDDDQGPNTGGMGTYSPVPQVSAATYEEAIKTIVQPVVRAMQARGIPFRGVLFAGLMVTPAGKPMVIEFNCRFGDPETQVVLMRLQSDLFPLLWGTATGTLHEVAPPVWTEEAAVCVVLASQGYPTTATKGDVITGLDTSGEAVVFHAGTVHDAQGQVVTNGGRVLGVTAVAPTIEQARQKVYAHIPHIAFTGKQFRQDIGRKARR